MNFQANLNNLNMALDDPCMDHPFQDASDRFNAHSPEPRLLSWYSYHHMTPARGHRHASPVSHGLPLPDLSAPLTRDNLNQHNSALRVKVERKQETEPIFRQYAHANKVKRTQEKKLFVHGYNSVTKKEEKTKEKPFNMEDLEEGEIFEDPFGPSETDEPPPRPIVKKQKREPDLKYDDDEEFNMNTIPHYKGIPGLGNYIKDE